MTDLEITRLCAEAMGLFSRHKDSVLYGMYEGAEWRPLADDAQAMALVKKFNMGWDKEEGHEWHIALREGENIFNAHNTNLNRAICECVAKMEKAKGESSELRPDATR